jgi:hypothetical protein
MRDIRRSGRSAEGRRDRLKAEVARLFGEHEGKYGSPRITADLGDAGWRVSENTVAALAAPAACGPSCLSPANAPGIHRRSATPATAG